MCLNLKNVKTPKPCVGLDIFIIIKLVEPNLNETDCRQKLYTPRQECSGINMQHQCSTVFSTSRTDSYVNSERNSCSWRPASIDTIGYLLSPRPQAVLYCLTPFTNNTRIIVRGKFSSTNSFSKEVFFYLTRSVPTLK